MSQVNERYKDVNENIDSNYRRHPKERFQVYQLRLSNKQQLENSFQSKSPIRINHLQSKENVSNEPEPENCPGYYQN